MYLNLFVSYDSSSYLVPDPANTAVELRDPSVAKDSFSVLLISRFALPSTVRGDRPLLSLFLALNATTL